MKSMKLSEFYEKYYKIKLPNGVTITPTLTDREKQIIDKAEELGVQPYIRIWKRKYGYQYIIHPKVQESI